MYKIIAVVGLVLALSSVGWADRIEVPVQESTVSGIGILSGWKCEAGTLTVRFNGDEPLEILYGSSRDDTLDVCGDSDNGYVLLVNYNLLGEGQHTAVVYDDEVEFDRVSFIVVTPGVEFLEGASGAGTIRLSDGQRVRVEWSEGTQGFVATEFVSPSICTTKTARVFDNDSDIATWEVTNPCDGETLDIDITVLSPGAFRVWPGGLVFGQSGDRFHRSHYHWFDRNTLDDLRDNIASGSTKETTVDLRIPRTSLDFLQPFQIYYYQELIFEFP